MTDKRTTAERILLWVGSIGPLGYVPASGTVAVAVAGVPLYLLMHAHLPTWGYGLVTAVVTLAGVWIHQVGDRILGEKDSNKLVVDELAGYFIAMTAVPAFGVTPTWQLVVLGFVLERGIDIVKVPPARWIERCWPGGWGVVGDDVVAGMYAFLLLHAVMRLAPSLVGIG